MAETMVEMLENLRASRMAVLKVDKLVGLLAISTVH